MKDKKDETVKVKKTKQPKIKKTINKEGLIIAIVVAGIVLITAGIVLYYFYFADNEKLATYDGGELTRGEFELYYKRIAPYYVMYYGYSATDIIPEIAKQAVVDELLYAEALKAKTKIKDEDKKEIEEMFANEDNVKSIQEQGLDIEETKNAYYRDTIINSYMDILKEKVTTEDLKAYIIENEGKEADFNIYNTSHILLQFKDEMTETEKATLKAKASKLLVAAQAKGADFAKLAKENSDDSSKDDGGKVSVKKNGSVYEEYINAAASLKPGKVYPKVVETIAGYHIVKLNSIDKNGRLTDDSEIATYVQNNAYALADDANYTPDEDRINQIGTAIGTELGLISQETEPTGEAELTEATE